MSSIYNVQPAEVDIIITKGDTMNVSFSVDMNGADYDLTGKTLNMTVKKPDNTVVKQMSNTGATPVITISTSSYNIYTAGFTEAGVLKYDLQVTDGTDILTIQKGKIIVKDEVTTA